MPIVSCSENQADCKSNHKKQRRVPEKFRMLSMPQTKNVHCCNLQLNCACVEAAAFAKEMMAQPLTKGMNLVMGINSFRLEYGPCI